MSLLLAFQSQPSVSPGPQFRIGGIIGVVVLWVLV